MFVHLEEELLRRLIKAEQAGRPLTHRDLGATVRGSTFEDLWAEMSIVAVGQESRLSCVVGSDTAYVASPHGKWRIAKLDAERTGKPVPAYPASEPVHL